MQKILVIGATGQLGSALMEEFHSLSQDYEIIGLNSSQINIKDEDSIQNVFKEYSPNIIINTAAYTDVNQSEINPIPAYELNAFAVLNLAKQCVEMQTTLLHFSTDYVFGSRQMRVLTEYDDPNPLNVYGASKLAGELMLKNTMDSGNVPWYIVRTSNLYGRNANKEKGTFLLNCLNKIKNKEAVYLNNTNMMSPTYANDVGQHVVKILQKECGLYHSTNFGATNPYDFIKTAINIISSNHLSNEYNAEYVILRNEVNPAVNRPRFSFMGSDKNVGHYMPAWEVALANFLVKNKDIL